MSHLIDFAVMKKLLESSLVDLAFDEVEAMQVAENFKNLRYILSLSRKDVAEILKNDERVILLLSPIEMSEEIIVVIEARTIVYPDQMLFDPSISVRLYDILEELV